MLSVAGSIVLLLLARFNLRLFLGHFAKEIQAVVPRRSAHERRVSAVVALMMGIPLISGLLWRTATLGSRSFGDLFAYAFGVLFIFNVVDLVILDWLILCWFKPWWGFLPGTEHIAVPNPYVHHFKEFLMGTVGVAVAGAAIAGLVSNQL